MNPSGPESYSFHFKYSDSPYEALADADLRKAFENFSMKVSGDSVEEASPELQVNPVPDLQIQLQQQVQANQEMSLLFQAELNELLQQAVLCSERYNLKEKEIAKLDFIEQAVNSGELTPEQIPGALGLPEQVPGTPCATSLMRENFAGYVVEMRKIIEVELNEIRELGSQLGKKIEDKKQLIAIMNSAPQMASPSALVPAEPEESGLQEEEGFDWKGLFSDSLKDEIPNEEPLSGTACYSLDLLSSAEVLSSPPSSPSPSSSPTKMRKNRSGRPRVSEQNNERMERHIEITRFACEKILGAGGSLTEELNKSPFQMTLLSSVQRSIDLISCILPILQNESNSSLAVPAKVPPSASYLPGMSKKVKGRVASVRHRHHLIDLVRINEEVLLRAKKHCEFTFPARKDLIGDWLEVNNYVISHLLDQL